MRIAITILGVLVVAVVGGAFLLSRLIAAEELRAGIIEESEALTGGPLQIEGRVDLGFLPRPTLSFSDARFAAPDGGEGSLEVDRVDLGVSALALLTGRVEIESVRLVRPRLTTRRAEDAPGDLVTAIAAQSLGPVRAGLTELTVVDGSAVVGGAAGDESPPLRLERIDIEVGARSDHGPFFIEGSFVHAGESYGLETRLGRLTADPATTIQIALGTIEGASFDLQLGYRGVIALDTLTDLRGQVEAQGDDLGRAVRALAPPAWRARLEDGPRLAMPFGLEGAIESESGRGRLGDLRLRVAGATADGGLDFDLAAAEVALVLDLPRLDLGAGEVGPSLLAPLLPLTHGVAGTVDLSIGALVRDGETARDARLGLDLDPTAGIGVRQLRAVLPGDTDVAFEGRLARSPEPTLDGRLTVVTDRLGAALPWLAPGVGDEVPGDEVLGGYRAMSLASGLVWTTDTVRLDRIDGRLDASRIDGDLELRLAGRPGIAADLTIDRFGLPPGLAALSAEQAFAALVDGIEHYDLDLALDVGRLYHGGTRLESLVLRGRAEDGRLELEQASATTLAATRVEASGTIDAGRERFEVTTTLASDQPGPLLRRLGLALPVSLARLGALELEGVATGWLEVATIEAEARIGALAGRASGGLGLTAARTLEADLDVEIVHPRYAGLIADLGLGGEAGDGLDGPVAGAGKVRLDGRGGAELIGHLALGDTRITGQVLRSDGPSGPSHEIRISLGEPRLAALRPLAGLAGYRPDGPLGGGPLLGALPRRLLATGPLRSFSGRLALSGKGGVVGDGLDAIVTGESGRLVIENAVLRLPDGEIEVRGEVDAGGPVPRIELTLEVRDLAVADLFRPLGIKGGLEGELALFGRIVGVGDTPYDLVRSLRGEVTFSVADGTVAIPAADADDGAATALTLLEGRADLWRGMAELTRLDVDSAAGLWQGEGALDLLLWIVELTLASEDEGGRRVRIVGRPNDPQVRIETRGAAAPAE